MTQDRDDKARASKQVERLIDRLRRGPATNHELVADLAMLKYTSRISDARKLGHDIRCTKLGGGLTRYELVVPHPKEQLMLPAVA